MLCILKVAGVEIKGWIIATSIADAIERAEAVGEQELADALRGFVMPRGGKQEILGGKFVVLGH